MEDFDFSRPHRVRVIAHGRYKSFRGGIISPSTKIDKNIYGKLGYATAQGHSEVVNGYFVPVFTLEMDDPDLQIRCNYFELEFLD